MTRSAFAFWALLLCSLPTTRTLRAEEPDSRAHWAYRNDKGAGRFIQTTEKKSWIEAKPNRSIPIFKEVDRNDEYIEISDSSRGVSVRMYANKSTWKHAKLTDGEWRMLWDGAWVRTLEWKDQLVEVSGSLTKHDAVTKLSPSGEPGKGVDAYCKFYVVELKKDQAYQVDLVSSDPKQYDPFLRVEDLYGAEGVVDDDSGEKLNARVIFRPKNTGKYQIIAGAQSKQTGDFTLTIRPKK